jgi:hypothetical protein
MTRAVVFFGPVSAAQREGATVEGAEEHFFTCTGDSHPNCAEQLGAFADGSGCYLPGLRHHFGIADETELYVGAFSNGGSAVKRILLNAADRAALRSVALSDATYELWTDTQRLVPGVAEGYIAFALEALDGSKLFLATASGTPNNVGGDQQPSGSQSLEQLALEIGNRSGQPLEQRTTIPGYETLDPPPTRVWTRGGVILADFGTTFAHAQHVTRLAPLLWPAVVQPWADRGLAALAGDSSAPTNLSGDPSRSSAPALAATELAGVDALGAEGEPTPEQPPQDAPPDDTLLSAGLLPSGTGTGLRVVPAGSGPWALVGWSAGALLMLGLLYHLLARRGAGTP